MAFGQPLACWPARLKATGQHVMCLRLQICKGVTLEYSGALKYGRYKKAYGQYKNRSGASEANKDVVDWTGLA